MSLVVLHAAMMGMVGLAVLSVIVAGLIGYAPLAVGAFVPVLGTILLFTEPFLGVMALTFFAHLDAVEKLLFGFLPVSAFKLIAAATALALLVTGARRRRQIQDMLREPTVAMILLFFTFASVSVVLADARAEAVATQMRTVSLVLPLLMIVILADTPGKVRILGWILVGTSAFSAVILIADFTLGLTLVSQSEAATTARTSEGVDRSSGASDYNPTTAASMLLVGVVYGLIHALESPRWRKLLIVVTFIGSVAVLLSFARSAALAYGCILAVLAWKYRSEPLFPIAVFGAFLGMIAALPFIPAEYWERIGSLFGGSGDSTLGRRLTYNIIGLKLFIEHPIFGVGPGNFVHHFTEPEYRFMPGRTLLGRELHNMYLSVLVQYGLLGGFAFFSVLVLSFRRLRAVIAAPANEDIRVHALCLTYGFSAYLIASLFLPNEYTKYTWIIPGIAVAMYLANERAKAAR